MALAGSRFIADFLAPPLDQVNGDFDTELEFVRNSPAETVRAAIDELREGGPIAAAVQPLYDNPERELGTLAKVLKSYWQEAIEPVWPRLRALHDADIGYRIGQLTTGGFVKVFAGLHPEVEFAGDRLLIDKPNHHGRRAAGAGLLLVPCAFAWPNLIVLHNEPYQPALTYSPRGVGLVWASQVHAEPLSDLVGRNRAALLAHLDVPLSTSQLASYLDMSAPAVSQHLGVLRRCRLVTARRSGRWVLYQRTELAVSLLGAAAESVA